MITIGIFQKYNAAQNKTAQNINLIKTSMIIYTYMYIKKIV